MIHHKRSNPMTLEDAILVAKWSGYLVPTPTPAEEKKAIEIVKKHGLGKELFWS